MVSIYWFVILVLVNIILWLLVFVLYLQKKRREEYEMVARAEMQKVEEERYKFRTIINSIGEGLYLLDKNERIVFFNEAAERILGFAAREVIGKKEAEVLDIKNKNNQSLCLQDHCPINEHWQKGKSDVFAPVFLKKAKGGSIPVSLSSAPFFGADGQPLYGVFIFRDISKELASEKAQTEFIGIASHQLRTPLNSIRWILELLLKGDLGKLTKKQQEFVEEAYSSNLRMAKLIDDLLNVSRVEAGKIEVVREPINMAELFDEVIKELMYLAKARNVKIINKLPDKLPEVLGDHDLVRHVVQNLIDNAVKYTLSGGKVMISSEPREDKIVFHVADTGIGIPAHQQDRVFEKFFRAQNAPAVQPSGTGLGLHVAKQLIEKCCQGEIWFESQEGKGSIFSFSLPLKK